MRACSSISGHSQSLNIFIDIYSRAFYIFFRCKSYELAALVEKLLKKAPRLTSGEGECYEMRKAYETSKALILKAQECATDAWDTLKVKKIRK